jgi:hypothetical protein
VLECEVGLLFDVFVEGEGVMRVGVGVVSLGFFYELCQVLEKAVVGVEKVIGLFLESHVLVDFFLTLPPQLFVLFILAADEVV